MDLQSVTKSIEELGALAKAGNIEVKKQLGELTEYTVSTDKRILDLEQKAAMRPNGRGNPRGASRLAFGELVANDPKIEQLRKKDIQSLRINVPGTLSQICKSVLVETGTSGVSPEFGFPVPTEYLTATPSQAPGRRLQVLQSLPHLPVGAGSATMPQISSTSDGSAAQEFQAGAKGESTMNVHGELLKMGTIANWLKASRQLLDDVATLPAFLQTWLGYFAMRRYETLICSGSGSESDGNILGLINAGTAATTGAAKNSDKVGQAIFEILPSFGYAADLVIMNSTDWFGVISERATTGQYVNPPGWNAAVPNSLWGVKAISTPALSSGTAVVLDSQLVSILDRQEISFFIGQPESDFTDNVFTYLAELRGQLAIGDPHAVQVVTLV